MLYGIRTGRRSNRRFRALRALVYQLKQVKETLNVVDPTLLGVKRPPAQFLPPVAQLFFRNGDK